MTEKTQTQPPHTQSTDAPKARANANRRRRPQQPQPQRRALTATLNLRSEAVHLQLFNNTQNLAKAIGRIAGLKQYTNGDPVIRERFDAWLEAEMAEAERRLGLLEVMRQTAIEEAGGAAVEGAKIEVPEEYNHTIRVTHPLYWRIIDLLGRIDKQVVEIENLWLMGMIEDRAKVNSQGLAGNIIKRLMNRFRYVSSTSANRKGGLYSQPDFDTIMASINKAQNKDDSEEAVADSIADAPINESETTEIEAA